MIVHGICPSTRGQGFRRGTRGSFRLARMDGEEESVREKMKGERTVCGCGELASGSKSVGHESLKENGV